MEDQVARCKRESDARAAAEARLAQEDEEESLRIDEDFDKKIRARALGSTEEAKQKKNEAEFMSKFKSMKSSIEDKYSRGGSLTSS